MKIFSLNYPDGLLANKQFEITVVKKTCNSSWLVSMILVDLLQGDWSSMKFQITKIALKSESTYLSQDGITIVCEYDTSHWIKEHLQH